MIRKFFTFAVFWMYMIFPVQASEVPDTFVFATVNPPETRIYKVSKAILSEALGRYGIKVALQFYPPKRAQTFACSGEVDGESHRIYSYLESSPSLVRVEEPVQEVLQSVFSVRTDIRVDGWKSLAPYKVIYIRGVKVSEDGLRGVVPDENLISVDTHETAFKMLARGRGDLTIASPDTGAAILKKLSLENSNIRVLSPPLVRLKLYTYLNEKHADIALRLAETLRSMKADGTFDRIVRAIPDS